MFPFQFPYHHLSHPPSTLPPPQYLTPTHNPPITLPSPHPHPTTTPHSSSHPHLPTHTHPTPPTHPHAHTTIHLYSPNHFPPRLIPFLSKIISLSHQGNFGTDFPNIATFTLLLGPILNSFHILLPQIY